MRLTIWEVSALCMLSSYSLGCSESRPKGDNTALAGATAQVTETAQSAVVCGGTPCSVPDMAFGADLKSMPLSIQACCAGAVCGLHVVDNAAIRDVCIPVETNTQTITGCPSYFDKPINVYKWGCCLPDGMCGEVWNGAARLGCSDRRSTNMTAAQATEPCLPGMNCAVMDAACMRDEDCCSIPPLGSKCVAFRDAAPACSPVCEVDSDCGTACCRVSQNGTKACAPPDVCLQP